MSFNESEVSENNTTQPELTELYQQTQKSQPKAEQPKQPKSAITKGSTSEQLEGAVGKTQVKAKANAIVNTKAIIAAGQTSGKEKAKLYSQAEQLAFLNGIADNEIDSAKSLLTGIPEYRNAINEASGEEVGDLIDFDEDLSIDSLKQQLNEAVGKSKKSQLNTKNFFGG